MYRDKIGPHFFIDHIAPIITVFFIDHIDHISIFPLYPLWSTTTKWNNDMLKGCTSFIDIFDFIFAGNREPDLFVTVI